MEIVEIVENSSNTSGFMGKTGKNLWKYRSGPAIPTHQEPKNFKRTGVCKQVRAWGPLAGRGGARSVRWSAGQGGGHGLRREAASLPAWGQGQGRERGRSVGRESGRDEVGDKPRGSAFVSGVAVRVEVPRSVAGSGAADREPGAGRSSESAQEGRRRTARTLSASHREPSPQTAGERISPETRNDPHPAGQGSLVAGYGARQTLAGSAVSRTAEGVSRRILDTLPARGGRVIGLVILRA